MYEYVSLAKGRASSAKKPKRRPTEPIPESSAVTAAETHHGGESASINEEG